MMLSGINSVLALTIKQGEMNLYDGRLCAVIQYLIFKPHFRVVLLPCHL
jgi:hypothetical protein